MQGSTPASSVLLALPPDMSTRDYLLDFPELEGRVPSTALWQLGVHITVRA